MTAQLDGLETTSALAIVDDTVFSGLTMRSVIAALPASLRARTHAFCLRGVAESIAGIAELCPITAGVAAPGPPPRGRQLHQRQRTRAPHQHQTPRPIPSRLHRPPRMDPRLVPRLPPGDPRPLPRTQHALGTTRPPERAPAPRGDVTSEEAAEAPPTRPAQLAWGEASEGGRSPPPNYFRRPRGIARRSPSSNRPWTASAIAAAATAPIRIVAGSFSARPLTIKLP